MQGPPTFTNWKNYYCKNGHITKDNLKIWYPIVFLLETEKKILNFIWKHKRPWLAKAILNKKSNVGCITITDFRLYYSTIVTKPSMVLGQNKHKSMEYNWSPRNKPADFWQRWLKYTLEKKIASLTSAVGKLNVHI
jgi:hypothetical protein